MAGFQLQLNFSVGQRIIDTEGCKGTIRYIGPVAAAKSATDIWLGNSTN